MFGYQIRRMPTSVRRGLVGFVVVVLAGAMLVMGVGGGNWNGAGSPTATANFTHAFSPTSTISATATTSQASLFGPTATPNPSGTFTLTGSMAAARAGHTATRLSDGRVLITGGHSRTNVLDSAELYDPATGTFALTGHMETARAGHTATLLADGRVLIAGGADYSRPLASAELYDPGTGSFSPAGSMATAREGHTATLLSDGQVLFAGGGLSTLARPGQRNLESTELYDPRTGAFRRTGSMTTPRSSHTATLLSNGRVLIAGGDDGTAGPAGALSSAEFYNPATGKFSPTGGMATARAWPTATLLSDGRVLLVGGVLLGAGYGPVASAELYDQATGTFSATGSMTPAHVSPTATLLSDGRVLIAGGYAVDGERFVGMLYTAELFDSATGTFGPTGSTLNVRENATTTLLSDGRVLVVGGDDGDQALLDSAELYTP